MKFLTKDRKRLEIYKKFGNPSRFMRFFRKPRRIWKNPVNALITTIWWQFLQSTDFLFHEFRPSKYDSHFTRQETVTLIQGPVLLHGH